MSVIIIDPCCFTATGIRNYIKQKCRRERVIVDTHPTRILTSSFNLIMPRLVIINDGCFSHHDFCIDYFRSVIQNNKSVLFIVFVSSFNIRYQELVMLDYNLIICSKEIKKTTLGALLSPNLLSTNIAENACNFSLSPTELILASLWVQGMAVEGIASTLGITAKTVSSHKCNIKRKLRTHNMQVIYNIVRLSEMLLPGPSGSISR